MSAPRHLLAAWPEIRRQLRRARHLALFSDFDGTLTRIRRGAAEVRLARSTKERLAELARRDVVIGIVSGRALEDVRAKVGLPGIWYIGAHGFFLRTPGNRRIALLSPMQQARMTRVGRALKKRLRGLPGVTLERKRATVAVHYRQASSRGRALARAAVFELVKARRGLRLLPGKKVWELLPGSPHALAIDKWRAIELALGHERRRHRSGWLVFYLGDDQTDERVFAKLDGVSVVIGRRRRTAARFYLRSSGEVHRFLKGFAQALP